MKTILLLFIALNCYSQTDTIFKKNGKIIPCTITLDNGLYLFFTDKKGNSLDIDKNEIVKYKQKNEIINNGIFDTDTLNKIEKEKENTLLSKSETVTDELNHLKKCMGLYHKQQSIGTGVLILGVGLSLLTAALQVDEVGLYIGSAAVALTGYIITVDANKFFKRASLGCSQNGLTVKYIFK